MQKKHFTLVEIMIVVAIIGLLAAIAIPSFMRARETSQTNACINNLRQIDGAKEQWAMDNNANTGDTITDTTDLDVYLKGTYAEVTCPAGGAYAVNVIGTDPTCDVGGDHTL